MPFLLQIQTLHGVQDLARVVGVLALYDLTPCALAAKGVAGGLKIDGEFSAHPSEGERCLNRLRQLSTVEIVAVPECRTDERYGR
jgi:hypothetical protein